MSETFRTGNESGGVLLNDKAVKPSESELSALLCGCGRPGKYMHFDDARNEVYACNKYKRCLTRNELESELRLATNRLSYFQKAINEIDDYFECTAESKKDQKQIYKILGNLTDALAT